MGIYKILGTVMLLCGGTVIYHATTILNGWQHRNKAALGVSDPRPYLELAFGLAACLLGIWTFLRKNDRAGR